MIDGMTIFKGIRFVDQLYKDISRLMATMDDQMEAMEYRSLLEYCYFRSSSSVAGSARWAPHAFTRVYVPEGKMNSYTTFTFLNIYLTPKNLDEPIAHWGVGRWKATPDNWQAWVNKFFPEGPEFLRSKSIKPFETSRELSEVLETFRHAVMPLIELNSEDQVESLLVVPIRKELGSLPDSARETPKPKSK